MIPHKFYLHFVFYFFILVGCTKRADDTSQREIAMINGASITKDELIRRLELTPLPEFHKPGGRNKRALDLLIDELVVSQWAKEQGLADSPGYKEAINFIKQQAMIRELFFEEIRSRAEPDPQQTDETLHKSLQRVTVDVLFTRDESTADEWNKELQQGVSFNELVKEFEGHLSVRFSEQSFHWGDGTAPIPLEKLAYRLNVGEASEVIEFPEGFGIMHVQHKVQDIFLTPGQLQQKRHQIMEVLQARIETELADEYVDKLLTPLQIKQKATGFHSLVRFLESEMNFISEDLPLNTSIFSDEVQISDDYDLSLAVVESPDFTWDGKDVLTLLRKYNYPINTRSPELLQKSLARFFRSALRDYYLAEQARKLGLESNKRVVDDIQSWGRYFLYSSGVSFFDSQDSNQDDKTIPLRRDEWIDKLREEADIKINHDLLENVELTGIPMLVLWNSDLGRQLAVPPLLEFR